LGDVLDDNDARSDALDDLREREPEPGLRSGDASEVSGDGEILAGEASANNVNVGPRSLVLDIFKPLSVGPMLREHRATERIDLALPHDRPKPGPFEAEL
jgi:hypothetical protein